MTRRPMVRQFVKFSLVGASNTVVDFAAYLLFTRAFGVHFLAANVIAFLLAATWSYNWNRRWTFRSNDPRVHRQFVKFLIVATVGLGLTTGILYFLVEHSGLTDIPAKIISVAAVLLWNFLANRFWTFKEKLV
ncbi:MAG: GtrA family protein [Patescibacteria group bacterium]